MSSHSGENLTENIHYMKLVHELKAVYPIVPDEFVKDCILKFGADRNQCVDILAKESDRLKTGPLNRRFSLQGRRSSLSSYSSSSLSKPGCDTLTTSPQNDNQIPRVVITPDSPPVHIPPMFIHDHANLAQTAMDNEDLLILGTTSRVSATLLDFDPGPENGMHLLDDNNNASDSNGMIGNLNEDGEGSSQSGQSMCSLSTATISHGELKVLGRNEMDEVVPLVTTSFTTVQCNSISVNADHPRSVLEGQAYTTTYSYPAPKTTSSSSSSHRFSNECPENPFRKLFAQRKEFYQTMSQGLRLQSSAPPSSVNRMLLKKRHCTLCCSESRSCAGSVAKPVEGLVKSSTEPIIPRLGVSSSRITLNANIEPFAPFKISHDLSAEMPTELTFENAQALTANSSTGDIMKVLKDGSGLELSADGQELRYATSTINSEEGVESHLEVSLGKDGGMITTRHKRLGSPSEISNNSVVQVQYDEAGGKILNIHHTQHKKTSRPNSLNLGRIKVPLDPNRTRPNSAHCTAVRGLNACSSALEHLLNDKQSPSSQLVTPLHNSLPNMDSHRRLPHVASRDLAASTSMCYNSHPADEEKRLAFTRALLYHQMEQRLKLEQELRQRAEVLERIKHDVDELQYKLRQREMIEHASLQTSLPASMSEGALLHRGLKHQALSKASVNVLESDVENLQVSCDKMVAEVTKLTQGKVPLGETSLEFYNSLALSNLSDEERSPVTPNMRLGPSSMDTQAGAEGPQWSCSECTFLNHPALDRCEECEMPRIALGGPIKPMNLNPPIITVSGSSPLS